MSDRWHRRFLDLARLVSSWSKDPSTKCGAVIVRPDRTIASLGYNGFPRGCRDDQELYDDRPLKYERVVHAEMNAILSAAESLRGYTIYIWPPSEAPTCNRCAAAVIQAGIRTVVWQIDLLSTAHSRWSDHPRAGTDMYREAGVEVVAIEPPSAPVYDMAAPAAAHFRRQRDWSLETFGPGPHVKSLTDHIRSELVEIETDPTSLEEWIDVAILAFDG